MQLNLNFTSGYLLLFHTPRCCVCTESMWHPPWVRLLSISVCPGWGLATDIYWSSAYSPTDTFLLSKPRFSAWQIQSHFGKRAVRAKFKVFFSPHVLVNWAMVPNVKFSNQISPFVTYWRLAAFCLCGSQQGPASGDSDFVCTLLMVFLVLPISFLSQSHLTEPILLLHHRAVVSLAASVSCSGFTVALSTLWPSWEETVFEHVSLCLVYNVYTHIHMLVLVCLSMCTTGCACLYPRTVAGE